ncbi:MAG: hypothetical protein EPO21_07820 [Chloroflexota bacterium]|nr:MAG: hypothetical protein EPO21_07820 [Chloroflexota bacterium]
MGDGIDSFASAYKGWLSTEGLVHGTAVLRSVVSRFPAFFGRDGELFLSGYGRWLERQGKADTEEAFAKYCEHRYHIWKQNCRVLSLTRKEQRSSPLVDASATRSA